MNYQQRKMMKTCVFQERGTGKIIVKHKLFPVLTDAPLKRSGDLAVFQCSRCDVFIKSAWKKPEHDNLLLSKEERWATKNL